MTPARFQTIVFYNDSQVNHNQEDREGEPIEHQETQTDISSHETLEDAYNYVKSITHPGSDETLYIKIEGS